MSDRSLAWAERLIKAEPLPLTVRVERDLRDLERAIPKIEQAVALLLEARALLGHTCLSRSVDDAHDHLGDLIAQIHDEVLGRLSFGREVERARRGDDDA